LKDLKSSHVLIVDDDAFQCQLVSASLKGAGLKVRIAKNLTEALEILDGEDPIDLIITDVHMPGGSGLDLVDIIRSAGFSIPIVVMTGDAAFSLANVTSKGATDFIKKPFEPARLLLKVILSFRESAARAKVS
jgi:CheY-like chemotaxis protein